MNVTHAYTPQGTFVKLFNCRDTELVVSGPAGTGKSRACLEKLLMAALANPGMTGLIVRKTLSSLGATGLKTWRMYVARECMDAGVIAYYGGSAEEPAQYRFTNGSTVVIGGMDKPSKIMSSEYDMIYVQECTELTIMDWEALSSRLRNWRMSFQQLLGDCNPDAPTHWIKQRDSLTLLESRHEDNPRIFNPDGALTEQGAEYIARLDALTGVRKSRLRYGQWVAAEGMIYDMYDAAVHLIDPFHVPLEWTRKWSVDFGFTNPFVWQNWAIDPDGRLYLVRELYRTRRRVAEHAVQMLDAVAPMDRTGHRTWVEPMPAEIVADHDAEGRAQLEHALGMSVTPAVKDVTAGIQAVQGRLAAAGDGKPRLFFMRGALIDRDSELFELSKPTCTEEEITSYVWDIRDGKPPKEVPIKEHDHGMDAMRYMVASVDEIGETRVRWL